MANNDPPAKPPQSADDPSFLQCFARPLPFNRSREEYGDEEMLQRAASNAYTWWWASHIRTNQSKWLDNNLNDMEDKVKSMLRIIEEDADTFAKKAELYFRKRPELIGYVQDSYRSYRALAERYDHLSGELHKANNTIATVFPDQVHFGGEDEDDDSASESNGSGSKKGPKTSVPIQQISLKKAMQTSSAQKTPHRRTISQMSVNEAQEEIDKLQKGILSLQTEKEFVKSSYERGLAKYMDIERRITEMQERVCNLQDAFSAAVIDDDEARALMVATAIKSCEDTLISLHEQQNKSKEDVRIESQRIKNASETLMASKCNHGLQLDDQESCLLDASGMASSSPDNPGGEVYSLNKNRIELQSFCENVRNNFKKIPEMAAIDIAEKIDELVNKVISLETTVSSHTAQIQRLRVDTSQLLKHLLSLDGNKKTLRGGSKDLNKKFREAMEDLRTVHELNKSVQEEGSKLQKDFVEAYQTFSYLSSRLQSTQDSDEVDSHNHDQEIEQSMQEIPRSPATTKLSSRSLERSNAARDLGKSFKTKDASPTGDFDADIVKEQEDLESEEIRREGAFPKGDSDLVVDAQQMGAPVHLEPKKEGEEATEPVSSQQNQQNQEFDDSPPSNWQQLFLDGLEDREKILLAEYTSVLRNYRETRRKLTEAEKKNQDYIFQTVAQMRELRNAFVTKDEEIRTLREKLGLPDTDENGNSRVDTSQTATTSAFTRLMSMRNGDASTASMPRISDMPNSKTPLSNDAEPMTGDGKDLTNQICQQLVLPSVEEKFRRDIDNLLDENLEFWLRFSSSFQQIKNYQSAVEELQEEILKLKDSANTSSTIGVQTIRPEPSSIYKNLKELQSDLSVWIEQNALLKEELQTRCSSLCNLSKEISRVSKEGVEGDELQFTNYQAAKFQGEVVNMQQENNKVANELQSGLDHVKGLQSELDKALKKLNENVELSAATRNYYQQQFRSLSGRAKIPLRSFLFGVKPKPKKTSIFSCMNQALQKQYSDLRHGLPS